MNESKDIIDLMMSYKWIRSRNAGMKKNIYSEKIFRDEDCKYFHSNKCSTILFAVREFNTILSTNLGAILHFCEYRNVPL